MLKIVKVKKYAQSPTSSSVVKNSKISKLKLSQKNCSSSAVVKTLKFIYSFTGQENKQQQGGAALELRRPRPASILLNEDDSRGRRI